MKAIRANCLGLWSGDFKEAIMKAIMVNDRRDVNLNYKLHSIAWA